MDTPEWDISPEGGGAWGSPRPPRQSLVQDLPPGRGALPAGAEPWLAHTWGDAGTPAPPVAQLGAPELCAVRLILWDEYLGYVVLGSLPAVDLRQPINLVLDDPLIGPAMVIGQIAPVGTRSAHPDDVVHVELRPGPLPGEDQHPVILKPAYQPPAHELPATHQSAVVKPAYQPPADPASAHQPPAHQPPADPAPAGAHPAPASFKWSGARPMLASYQSRFDDPTLPDAGAIVEAGPAIAGFVKGVAEGVADGVVAGVEGAFSAVEAVGRGAADTAHEAYALATDAEARRRMGAAIAHAAKEMGDLADALWHHPGATARQALEAAGAKLSATKAVLEQQAAQIAAAYRRAADEGRGAEFIGHAAGEGVAAVGSLLLGGEVAAGLKAAAAATTLAAAKSTAKLAQALKALEAARGATTATNAARTTEALLVLEQRLQELAAAGQELDRAEQDLAELQAKVARMAQKAKAGDVAGNEPAGSKGPKSESGSSAQDAAGKSGPEAPPISFSLRPLRPGEPKPKPGRFIGTDEDWKGLTKHEKLVVRELLDAGHSVEPIDVGPNKTPDFKIKGVTVELKEMSKAQPKEAHSFGGTVVNRLLDARKGEYILLDAKKQPGMTREIAQDGIKRTFDFEKREKITKGKIPRIRKITIWTPDGVVEGVTQP